MNHSPLRLFVITSITTASAFAQTPLFVNKLKLTTGADLDAGSPAGKAFDPGSISLTNPHGVLFVADGSPSPQGGKAFFGAVAGPVSGNVASEDFTLNDLVDANGLTVSLVNGQSYNLSFWYKPSIVSDGSGNSWTYLPTAINTYGAVLEVISASFAPNSWTTVSVPLVYNSLTMSGASSEGVILSFGAPSLLAGTSTANANANYAWNGAIDFGISPTPIPEPSAIVAAGLTGLLGLIRRKR